MDDARVAPAFIRAVFARPGAFDANARLLLADVRRAAKAGQRRFVVPADALTGGDCGALKDHPAFKRALARAEARFRAAAKKIAHGPQLVFSRAHVDDACISTPGPDPRFPFGGRADAVFGRQVFGLARRLAALRCQTVVIGLSGGLDSALALLVAVGAFDLLGLDPAGIHVFTLPGFGTTKRTRGNADLLAEGLGLSCTAIDITAACRRHFADIGQDPGKHDVTFENAQARMRTLILMDKANQLGGIVLGTGDLSEIALGWSTYNGDHMSMFGVNAGIPKTVVRETCRFWADAVCAGKPVAGVPAAALPRARRAAEALLDILATPVSPELLPAVKGRIVQKTEDRVGPYELHDFFLWHFLTARATRRELLARAKKAFKGVYDAATIGRWLDVFLRRFVTQAFKRNCAPDGIRVFSVCLAPDVWRIPSDFSADWLYNS